MARIIQKITCKLPEGQQRIESGPLQVNEDWPGTFIRGDNAIYYAFSLQLMLDRLKREGIQLIPFGEENILKNLIEDLNSCQSQ
jgi:hypothetical protein